VFGQLALLLQIAKARREPGGVVNVRSALTEAEAHHSLTKPTHPERLNQVTDFKSVVRGRHVA
jgi:hypothetical protein